MTSQTTVSIIFLFVILSAGCEEITLPLDIVEAESEAESGLPYSDTTSDAGQSTDHEEESCKDILRKCMDNCDHSRSCEDRCWELCDDRKDDWEKEDCEDQIRDCIHECREKPPWEYPPCEKHCWSICEK